MSFQDGFFSPTNVAAERVFSMFKHIESKYPIMRITLKFEMTKGKFNKLTFTPEAVQQAVPEEFRKSSKEAVDINFNLRVEAQTKRHEQVSLFFSYYTKKYNIYFNIQ